MSEDFEEKEKYLVYRIENELYASALLDFKEVVEYSKPKSVPNMPQCFSGMINLRGLIIGVIHLRLKLGINRPYEGRSSILICETSSGPIGAIIDKVECVIPIHLSEIQDMKVHGRVDVQFLKGFFQYKDELITILDIKKFTEFFEDVSCLNLMNDGFEERKVV